MASKVQPFPLLPCMAGPRVAVLEKGRGSSHPAVELKCFDLKAKHWGLLDLGVIPGDAWAASGWSPRVPPGPLRT